MSKAFASQADLADKKITFEQLSAHCWAYTAEGDPNSGVIIGDKFILVSDATATPAMARDLIARIRTVSDKPIKYVLLTHYHAVRVLGASAFAEAGCSEIIASQGTLDLIHERGAQRPFLPSQPGREPVRVARGPVPGARRGGGGCSAAAGSGVRRGVHCAQSGARFRCLRSAQPFNIP